MSYALNNASITGTPTVFSCAGAVKQNILVANNPVLITPTFRDIAGNTTTGAQIYLAPGFYTWRKPVNQLSIVQAVTAQTALVTVEGLLLQESNQ